MTRAVHDPYTVGQRVVRALENAGITVARIAGSHYVMRHPDGRGTTVPVRQARDVAKATLRGVLADAQLSVEELSLIHI